ncbi:MAG: hypothetical protein ACSHXB_15085 [Sulfitobacter sp.]
MKSIKDTVLIWIGWLGVFFGVSSAISATARLFDTELKEILQLFVDFYRGALEPFYLFLGALPLPFAVEPVYVDLFAIYSVLVGLQFRLYVGYSLLSSSMGIIAHPEIYTKEQLVAEVRQSVVYEHPKTRVIEILSLVYLRVIVTFVSRFFQLQRRLDAMGASREIDSNEVKRYVAWQESGPTPLDDLLNPEKANRPKIDYSKLAGDEEVNRTVVEVMYRHVQSTILQFATLPFAVVLFFVLNAF